MPDYAEAFHNLGFAQAMLGKTEQAIANYKKALKRKPGYAEAHYNLGNTLLQKGRAKEP